MKTETLSCANPKCRKLITGKGPAVASNAGGKMNFFCGWVCRRAFSDAGGVVDNVRRRPPRILTDAEIRRKIKRDAIPSEAKISKSAENLLDGRGVYHTRLQSGKIPIAGDNGRQYYMNLCRTGTPDRMFADGLICFLEIKKPGERPGDDQLETIADLRSNGALVFVVDDYGQSEFIVNAIDARRSRIDEIREAIQELQSDILADFKLHYGDKN